MPDSTLSELLLAKPSVSRVTRSSQAEPPQSDSAADEIVNEAQCRIGRRPQMMIVFRKCSGRVVVRPYSMLQGIETDDSERSFRMDFPNLQVTISGDKLQRLFEYACQHRVTEIREAGRTEALEFERLETVVSQIRIT